MDSDSDNDGGLFVAKGIRLRSNIQHLDKLEGYQPHRQLALVKQDSKGILKKKVKNTKLPPIGQNSKNV